jgi:hypothetical protein
MRAGVDAVADEIEKMKVEMAAHKLEMAQQMAQQQEAD